MEAVRLLLKHLSEQKQWTPQLCTQASKFVCQLVLHNRVPNGYEFFQSVQSVLYPFVEALSLNNKRCDVVEHLLKATAVINYL